MGLAVLETVLYATDLDAADAFYGTLLGLKPIMRKDDRHTFYHVDNGVLLIFNPDITEEEEGGTAHGMRGRGHMAFVATPSQQDAWETKLNAAGYPTKAKVEWPNGAVSVYFRDPADNSIEFAQARLWEKT